MNIATYPKYESYKDAEAEWLGQIPSTWATMRTKYIWRETSGVSLNGSEQLLSVSQKNGVIPRLEQSRSEDLTGYRIVRSGELVSNIMLAWMGALGVSRHDGIVSPAYSVFRLQGEADEGFLDYLYKTDSYLAEFARRSSGVVPSRWRLYTEDFGEVLTLLPPLPEQRAIAAFLDGKCATIDEAVRIKEEQIRLLAERRQILIQQAVTLGLNPDAPMKDSGIDWIGQIPAHWEVKRNKHMFVEINERSAKGEEQHLSMSQKLGLVPADLVEKSLASESYQGAKLVRTGDLVLNRLKAHLAVFSLAPMEGLVSPDYSVFRPLVQGASSDYFEILFKTSKYLGEFRLRVRGIVEGFYRLYTDDFMDCPLLLPPLDEQLQIVEHVRATTAQFHNVIAIKESQITALREYKTSLINAAVTGKIKVL